MRSLSLDYLNLLINGQAFSDVTFSVEGRLVHAHRCILAARSMFFRKFFSGPDPPSGLDPSGSRPVVMGVGSPGSRAANVIPVNSVGYEVFLLLLQFLYSGQVSIVPQKHEPRPNCGERGCWHTHCTSAVDLALETLAAARYFGVEQLALLTQVFILFFFNCIKHITQPKLRFPTQSRPGLPMLFSFSLLCFWVLCFVGVGWVNWVWLWGSGKGFFEMSYLSFLLLSFLIFFLGEFHYLMKGMFDSLHIFLFHHFDAFLFTAEGNFVVCSTHTIPF